MSEGQNNLDKILLKAIIDSPGDLIILAIDRQYNYIAFNGHHSDVMLSAYGKKVEPGMNLLECITSIDDVKKSKLNYDRALKGDSHITVEEFGEIDRQYYETRYSPIYNENKAIIGATAFSSNVTERILLQQSLKNSEEKFRKAFTTSPDSVNINRLSDGMYVAINEGFTKIMGYREKDVSGKTSVELNIWNNSNDRAKLVKGLRSNGSVENLEAEFRKRDGLLVTGLMSATIIDLNGVPHILSITRDVTERKLMENALIQSESKYKELIELAPDGILIGNKDGIITDANSSLLKITGRSSNEIIGTNISRLFSDDEVNRTPLRYDLLQKGISVTRERVIKRPDSTLVNIEMHSKMMPDGTYQSIWHDITRRKQNEILLKEQSNNLSAELENRRKSEKILQKSMRQLEIAKQATLNLLEDIRLEMEHRIRAEEEIREMNIELEQRVAERTTQLESANAELEAFAFSVSHDLRAPLRAIDGFSKFLMEDYGTKLDAEGSRLLKLIRSNTKKMDRLIIDILALSRVSRNVLKKSKVDMTKMALSMLNEVAPPEIIKNLNIVIGKLPPAFVDSIYLKQVWINLISNAIKFSSKEAKPKIEFGGYDDNGHLVYYVKDNGVGFNQDFAHKLFGVFQRLHKTDEFEGNGVGLAIVQRIILRHGGNVWAEGKVGQGATFYFSLPAGD